MPFQLTPRPELGVDATFIPNKAEPVYNWFYYKEGFSRQMVELLLDEFSLGSTVLDPFCGSGTTLLACKQRGIDSIGIDVSPSALLASRVKTADYDVPALRDAAKQLFSQRYQRQGRVDVPPFIKPYFSKYAIEDLLFYRSAIEPLPARDFFLLALINTAMKVSWAWKDGGALKVRKHPAPPVRLLFKRVVKRWLKDVEGFASKPASVRVVAGDARFMREVDTASVDAIITSPPYLNQIDYTKVYRIENWLASGEPSPALRSFVGLEAEEDGGPPELAGREMPPAAVAYFRDMAAFLAEAARVSKRGARAGIVVGNAFFPPPWQPVESDVILAEMAENRGFRVDNIWVLNQRAALVRRTEKVGLLRESAILLTRT